MTTTSDIAAAIPLPNGSAPIDGVLTAGQPTAAQFQQLAAAGIRTVLDLRPPGEPRGFDEAAAARAVGMGYHNVPVTAATLADADFDRVRELLGDPDRRPILVHCASANRVGALLMPYLTLDEQRTPEESLDIAHRIGLRSDELARTANSYIAARRASDTAR